MLSVESVTELNHVDNRMRAAKKMRLVIEGYEKGRLINEEV